MYLFCCKQHRSSCQSKTQISSGWFAQLGGCGYKIQEIIDQLESHAKLAAKLEGDCL